MTLLAKPVKRELPRPIDRAAWIVELDSVGATFRRKRSRLRYSISWESIWNKAMLQAAEQHRMERAERRKHATRSYDPPARSS